MSSFVRVDVWSLAEDHPILTAYGDAVAAMKAKAANDPTSWTYQAAIHGSLSAHPPAGWNQCRHGSWYFVSWHRMYLYYFERIVRAQVVANGGSEHWALPYWNYDGGSGHNAIPTAFRQPTRTGGGANPLYVADRAAGINAGAGLPASITTSSFALSRPSFTGASEFGGGVTSPLNHFFSGTGRLEQTPHNDVHVAMGGLMGDPSTAAEDPIFWLHHANIDRIWWLWQHHHHSSSSAQWTGQSFDFFDAGGAAAAKTDADVLHTIRQLDYTYDHKLVKAPKPPAPKAFQAVAWPGPWPPRQEVAQREAPAAQSGEEMARHLVGASDQPVQLVGETLRVPVAIDTRAAEGVQAQARTATEHRAFLDLDDVEADRNPGTVYGVYVNLPDAPSDEVLAEHHVGNLSLFGVERARTPLGDEHAHGLHTSMDITDLLDRLAALGQWQDGTALDVTFRPIGLEPPEGAGPEAVPSTAHPDQPITVGRVSVHFG